MNKMVTCEFWHTTLDWVSVSATAIIMSLLPRPIIMVAIQLGCM